MLSCQICKDPTWSECEDCGKPACERHSIDDVCENCLFAKGAAIAVCCLCGDTILPEKEIYCRCSCWPKIAKSVEALKKEAA